MIVLEPKRLEERYIKLQQQNKKMLMETEVLGIIGYYLIIDESWDFDLDSKYIKCKKIKGNVWLKLNHIPGWMKHIKIDGSFDCSIRNLTSLENCPKIINGYFDCKHNKLTSLEDGPTFVGNVYCCYNNITYFTKEYVTSICNVKESIINI